ncbi:MAG: AAA family ATPase [Caulobacteraceae bacterium]
MLIKKITLHNFRQYIGTQEVEFSTNPEKNVTVLVGVNTSGKTTFVRAFEWILYNKNEFDDKNLLNQNVVDNMQVGEIQEVTGSIVLIHGGKEFEINRKQVYTCIGEKKVRPSISSANIMYLQPDGQTKTQIGSDFDSNIERILPRALSNYFFFGGERVGTISNRQDIESSVKGLMGLDVLYNAMEHLRLVINKLKKSMDFSGDQNARNIQLRLDGANAKRQECEDELNNINEQIDYYQSEKEKYAALLKANEETAAAQHRREQLDSVINALNARIEKDKKDLVTIFSRNGFAFFSMPLLKRVIEILDKASDKTESVPEMTATSIDYILKRGVCICGTYISEGSVAEKHLLAEKVKQPPESIGSLVRRYREQAMDYLSSSDNYYSSIESKFADIRSNQRELGFRIDERVALDESLKGAKDVATLEAEYKKAENKVKELERQRNQLNESIGACKKDIANYEKALESYGKANEKNAKISLNIDYAQATFDWVSEAYRTRESTVRSKLEQKVNANFVRMYHGSRNITIDEKYRVKYIDVTTEESDGLKAVKSFAFVSGLVDLAKEALSSDKSREANIGPQYYPLVMDAPFSNVDETHIRNICQILPQSAEQVIIAVMQKDWEPAAVIMEPFVGKSYRIEKDIDAEGKAIDTMTHIR